MPQRRIGLAFLPLLALGALTLAQEQTASIEGTIRDSQGGTVPGAVVTVRGRTGLTVERATGDEGLYFFPALPPGQYALTATHDGFGPAQVERIDLRLGDALTIDLTLEPASIRESVTVVPESPLISISGSAHTTSLRDEEIEKMPKGRDFTSLVSQIAGVNQEPRLGGISVDGSSAAENRFIVDGAEFTDLREGLSNHEIVTDFVDELQVKSSGYSAEYGGSTGGVINLASRSGSNDFHADGLLHWSSDALDAAPRPSLGLNPVDPSFSEYVTYPKDSYHSLEPGFTLGGPIKRDRVWFFAGYIPELRPIDRTVTFLANGQEATYHADRRVEHAVANVKAQLGSRWRLRLGATHSRWTQRGELPRSDGSGDPDADYSIDWIAPRYTVSASVDYLASPRAFLSLRGAYFYDNWYNEGVHQGDMIWYRTSSIGYPGVPPEYQRPNGYSNVASNYSYDFNRSSRFGLQLDAALLLSGVGQHQLKAGLQLDRRRLDVLHGQTGNIHQIYWGRSYQGQSGPFGYYRVNSNSLYPNKGFITAGEATLNDLGLFVQDRWTIGRRLTLNLGLRSENEHVPSFSSNPEYAGNVIEWGFGDKLAPRVGFAWDVRGDGRLKLYGSWGLFYDIMKLALPLTYFDSFRGSWYWYTLDSPDLSRIENNPSCPPECPGALIASVPELAQMDEEAVVPGLEPMKLQEAALGVDYELVANLVLNVRYVHKQVDRAVEDVGIVDGHDNEIYTVANPGFGEWSSFVPQGGSSSIPFPRARRDYDAVEIGLDRRFSDGWYGRLSYTWSRLWGSYSGLSSSDENGKVSPNLGFNFDHPMMAFDERGQAVYGPLATDRPHQVKAQFLREFHFGTSVGLSWFGASGIPRTRQARFNDWHNWPVMYYGRLSDGRMPFLSQLDLLVQHQIGLGRRTRLTLSANVINLFDQATPINYWQDELYEGQTVSMPETEFYAGFDTQQLIAEQGVVRDARFLMDRDYQAPRTIRLGVKLSF